MITENAPQLITSLAVAFPTVTAEMAHDLAVAQKVCVRPIVRRVLDQVTGEDSRVAIPCGSTREAVCPSCSDRARRLRIQQCAAGWHRTDEPEVAAVVDQACELSQDGDPVEDDGTAELGETERRVRSTRRRQDAPDLPRVPVEDRTVGRAFVTPDGREYRPSMFLTLTLPSYGRVRDAVPVDPGSYDYRRAALDALHFPKLVDRFWQKIRRCAGYRVQYFAAVEPQHRLAPHLHAAIRGAIPRATIRRVVQATYVQVWWPAFDRPVYVDRVPVWDGSDYVDADTGAVLPTWAEAVDLAAGEDRPAHVMRFGTQLDMAGIIAPSEDADRAVRYLTKYLAKSITSTFADPEDESADAAYVAHVDRLHEQLRWLPCSEQCSNWLRYGVQPKGAGPGLRPGWCSAAAHERENAGVGGRRVLVSRQWSGKTLRQHHTDRATVVRETLLSAGIVAPEIERMAASVTLPDGRPRFVWTDTAADPKRYAQVISTSVVERSRWRAQYDAAKAFARAVHTRSATPAVEGDPDG